MFVEFGFVSSRVRLDTNLFCIGTCSTKSAYCRDMSGDVGFVSGIVRRGLISVGT